jgi:hypothetical protein
VFDESHWEVKNNGMFDQQIDHTLLLNSPNVLLLYVTTTPKNIITHLSEWLTDNVIDWKEAYIAKVTLNICSINTKCL